MEAKEKIEALKKLLFEKEEVKQVFLDAQLEDGTIVKVEPAIEVGAAVVIIQEDGEVMPAPDGQHKLATGEEFITVEGAITEIVEAEEDEIVAEPVVEQSADPAEQEQKVKKIVESIVKESHFANQSDINEVAESLRNEFKKLIISAFEEYGKEPETVPTEKKKFNAKDKKTSWVDRFNKQK